MHGRAMFLVFLALSVAFGCGKREGDATVPPQPVKSNTGDADHKAKSALGQVQSRLDRILKGALEQYEQNLKVGDSNTVRTLVKSKSIAAKTCAMFTDTDAKIHIEFRVERGLLFRTGDRDREEFTDPIRQQFSIFLKYRDGKWLTVGYEPDWKKGHVTYLDLLAQSVMSDIDQIGGR